MKRIFKASFAISALSVTAIVLTAGSTPKATPKATGDVQWVNNSAGTQAHTVFNAIATATTPDGTDAKGSLLYDDGTYVYTMDVKYMKVEGNTAWFAGQVTANPGDQRCCVVGNWIFYKVQDLGEPGIGRDQIWGEDLGPGDSDAARDRVKSGPSGPYNGGPIGGPFVITGGNLQVHNQ